MTEKIPKIPNTADELVAKIDKAKSPEIAERRKSFLSRLRSGVANELRLTSTLPKPGEGLMRDIALKGFGVGNIIFMNTVLRGAEYLTPPDQQAEVFGRSSEAFMTQDFPTIMTVIGAGAILLANRVRSLDKKIAEEREAKEIGLTV